jgi:hypothetical protein
MTVRCIWIGFGCWAGTRCQTWSIILEKAIPAFSAGRSFNEFRLSEHQQLEIAVCNNRFTRINSEVANDSGAIDIGTAYFRTWMSVVHLCPLPSISGLSFFECCVSSNRSGAVLVGRTSKQRPADSSGRQFSLPVCTLLDLYRRLCSSQSHERAHRLIDKNVWLV